MDVRMMTELEAGLLASLRKNIAGQTAIVTGAASGIGKAVCLALVARGAQVIGCDLDPKIVELVEAWNELGGCNKPHMSFVGDVTDIEYRQRVFSHLKGLDFVPRILVPAAGITGDQLLVKVKEGNAIALLEAGKLDDVFKINLKAPIMWTRDLMEAIVADRLEKGLRDWEPTEVIQGTVVFVGSVCSQGNYGQAGYAATKSALRGLSETVAMEGKRYGIRSCVVHPGYTNTPMLRSVPERVMKEKVLPRVRAGRLMEAEEIAEAVCFVISNAAISRCLWVDGGYVLPA